MQKTSVTLQKARQKIIDHGWKQFSVGTYDGPTCAMGAIYWQIEKDQELLSRREAYSFVRQTIDIDGDIGVWNDTLNRTKEQVLQMFDEAISMAMSEEAVNGN